MNSLMDRVTNEAFSPSGLHKLVPLKDSLQRFGMLNLLYDLDSTIFVTHHLSLLYIFRNEYKGCFALHNRSFVK